MDMKEKAKLKKRAENLAPVSSQRLHVPVRRDELLWLLEHSTDFNLGEAEDH